MSRTGIPGVNTHPLDAIDPPGRRVQPKKKMADKIHETGKKEGKKTSLCESSPLPSASEITPRRRKANVFSFCSTVAGTRVLCRGVASLFSVCGGKWPPPPPGSQSAV